MKKLTFFFCRSKIISTFAALKTKISVKNKAKKRVYMMSQMFNINLLSIIILLERPVGSECYAVC